MVCSRGREEIRVQKSVQELPVCLSQLLRVPFRREPHVKVDRLDVAKHLIEVRVVEIISSFAGVHQGSKSGLPCVIVLGHGDLHFGPEGDWTVPLYVERPP